MAENLQYLLLQVRTETDPMRDQEVECFARSLRASTAQIRTIDLLAGIPPRQSIDRADVVLLGGSGDFSVVQGGPWLEPALETMRQLYRQGKPTFASCWGFQAMALALGGKVVTDLSRAEVGTHVLHATAAGQQDLVFRILGSTFSAQMGHVDIVETLPEGAVLLASSQQVTHQAFTFADKPIYCTQFHPELRLADLLRRLKHYPQYVEQITGLTAEVFFQGCYETPEASRLLEQFVQHRILS